jgi:hypothetical protein
VIGEVYLSFKWTSPRAPRSSPPEPPIPLLLNPVTGGGGVCNGLPSSFLGPRRLEEEKSPTTKPQVPPEPHKSPTEPSTYSGLQRDFLNNPEVNNP